MASYEKFTRDGKKVQVESAIRDGSGKNIENNYAKQDGSYEPMNVGNLIPDMNYKGICNFVFGTGDNDTVDGEATFLALKGHTDWSEPSSPKYVNVISNKSVIFNLWNGTNAHVVESDDENNGLCIYGTGIEEGMKIEFASDIAFTEDVEQITITSDTNSTGYDYLKIDVQSDGYIRPYGFTAPEDFCVSNVWGGYRVNQHPSYAFDVVAINSQDQFSSGMKSINIDGEDVIYDELVYNKKFERVGAYSFGATPSVSYQTASGTFNIYRMSLSSAMNKGLCIIGGSNKFLCLDIGQMTSSTPISVDSMSLYTNYIYFAIAQSEDTSYTYAVDEAVVDAESFATQKEIHTLYTESSGVYTEANEYTSGTTYYYVSATNVHGLNGKAINDEIANKIVNYQIKSMDKTVYTGTNITAKDWNYEVGDFGTEELSLATGYTAVPVWEVSYPINVKESVQRLPENYVSVESAEDLLHSVGDIQGFDFDSISYNNDTGKLQVNGLVDTKETIVNFSTNLNYSIKTGTLNETDQKKLASLLIDGNKMKQGLGFWVRDTSHSNGYFTTCYGRYGNYLIFDFFFASEHYYLTIMITNWSYQIRTKSFN